MTSPGVDIEVRHLTKKFGGFTAVNDLSFSVQPGRITGFLGPNGSGKTTTLRMLLGLVRPTAGEGLIGGKKYVDIRTPLTVVGAALEATSFHPGRSGRDHLRVLAASQGVKDERVDELLELVGIPAAANRRAGAYSMGMRQRLGLAAALIGTPDVLILDEPANGLDPEGIRWLRQFLSHLAHDQGLTILVSSHLLSEVEQTVDDVVIIANGELVRQGTIEELHGESTTLVRSPKLEQLASALTQEGLVSERTTEHGEECLVVQAPDLTRIGDLAHSAGAPIHELRTLRTDLERLYFELTESPEHQNRNRATGHDPGPGGPPQATQDSTQHSADQAAADAQTQNEVQ